MTDIEEQFLQYFRKFLITFKNTHKKVSETKNYENNKLKFQLYLKYETDLDNNINQLKFISLTNSDCSVNPNCITEDLLFSQATQPIIICNFDLYINNEFEDFDNLLVDTIILDLNFKIKFSYISNNFQYYKNYLSYKRLDSTLIDKLTSDYLNLSHYFENNFEQNFYEYIANL
jgi:hypothetical protein